MATFVTSEIDPAVFKAGIFISRADVAGPVSIDAEKAFQYPQDVGNEIRRTASVWGSYVSVAGIAQYSLLFSTSLFALARFNTYFRQPTYEEISRDINELSDQIIDDANTIVGSWRTITHGIFTGLQYTGPERFVKSVFITRVCEGELPSSIEQVVQEVDALSEADDMVCSQGYQFFFAKRGELFYLPFLKPQDYASKNIRLHGVLNISENDHKIKMGWTSYGETQAIDFTQEYFSLQPYEIISGYYKILTQS